MTPGDIVWTCLPCFDNTVRVGFVAPYKTTVIGVTRIGGQITEICAQKCDEEGEFIERRDATCEGGPADFFSSVSACVNHYNRLVEKHAVETQ